MGDNRVVVLVDMDCFYCQVEVRLRPIYSGKPLAVVQYNAWRGGGIIAVNYEARDKGVKRGMRGDQAKKLCPEIVLCRVEENRGKADLTKYRDAGREVVNVLHEFSSCIQVASIDESYMDITEAVEERLLQFSDDDFTTAKLSSTFVIGYTDDNSNDEDQRAVGLAKWLENVSDPSCLRLAVGAMIAEEMRAAVFERTSFRCSAGISYNKPLAKLVCGVHKPNRQTVLPPDKVEIFFSSLPVRKMRNLGGKFGMEVVERLGCQTMGDLAKFSLQDLQRHYDEKNGLWLYNIAHGIDHEPVTVRLIAKSIGCSKNFPGRTALSTKKNVEYWMHNLISELVVRLTEDQTKNKRRAQHLTVSVSQDGDSNSLATVTRSGPLPCYDVDRILSLAIQLISKTNTAPTSSPVWDPAIKNISLSAGKFTDDCTSQKTSIQSFFKHVSKESESSPRISELESMKKRRGDEDEILEPKEKKLKRSSLENYFKPSTAASDNDSSIDMFLDETSMGSDYNENLCRKNENADSKINFNMEIGKGVTSFSQINRLNKSSKSETTDSSSVERNDPSQSVKHTERVVCPESLEEVRTHSFFARYILSKKEDTLNGANVASTLKPESKKLLGATSANVSIESEGICSNDPDENCDNTEEMYEKCEECGELVALQEFPEHVDYHSALKLQKELNETLTPPENNEPGPSNVNSKKASHPHRSNDSVNSIPETHVEENELKNEPPMEKCSSCGKMIPLQDFPEHVDYHSALNLQRELNKANNAPPVVASSNVAAAQGGKKKKGRAAKQISPTKKGRPSPTKKPQSNTIASFFGPKQD
ncbi:DNA polymerase eta [Frankliniella occidentalis]|uniref:DNA polymerase eta n=1 Tax=Frankliniella occidentalis TaxID=133901 RepID=A0A6J1TIU0_FRAOC|nr:DNA polymerase eta [Frankliniella occidentalis]